MSDSEYEEEEILVYADFKNQLLSHEIADPKLAVKIIGIETNNPIAEVNGHIFKGSYDDAVGTHVFFEKDENALPDDPMYDVECRQKYKYFDKTTKVLNFQRIFLDTKEDNSEIATETIGQINETESPNNIKSLNIDMTYEEAIQQFPSFQNKSVTED